MEKQIFKHIEMSKKTEEEEVAEAWEKNKSVFMYLRITECFVSSFTFNLNNTLLKPQYFHLYIVFNYAAVKATFLQRNIVLKSQSIYQKFFRF